MNICAPEKTKDKSDAVTGKRTNPAVHLEETRLQDITGVEDFDMFHERHRIFPAVFENRNHKRVIDLSAGIGAAADRVNKYYDTELVCNELSPKCLDSLKRLGLKTTSFDLDDTKKHFPIGNGEFDAVISLATIEHLYNTDHFIAEIRRILTEDGYLYLSAPNYNAINYLIPLLLKGNTFHDPLNPKEKYEFFGHLRYFTHISLIKYITRHGFTAVSVYLGKPKMGSRYLRFKSKHKIGAAIYKALMLILYYVFPARWASEPVICFKKSDHPVLVLNPKKRVL